MSGLLESGRRPLLRTRCSNQQRSGQGMPVNAPRASASTIERSCSTDFEVKLPLARSTQSPPPPITVDVSRDGNAVDLTLNLARVARFNRQVVAEWLSSPGPDALSTGPVLWQHTTEGVTLGYCGQRHVLSIEAVNELAGLL